jgi:hypothetical protein
MLRWGHRPATLLPAAPLVALTAIGRERMPVHAPSADL